MSKILDITLSAEQREGTKATLQQWLVSVGDKVTTDQPIAELETDKVTMEVCAPGDGTIKELLIETGAEVEDDIILGRIAQISEESAANDAAQEQVEQEVEKPVENVQHSKPVNNEASNHNESARHKIGPAVRRLIAEHSLDIEQIAGTGKHGRVTRHDVVCYIENPDSRKRNVQTATSKPSHTPIEYADSNLPSEHIPHTAMRKGIAKHMVDSLLHTSPHVTSVFEMNMSNIIEHRKWHKKEYLDKGVKLTFTAYFLAACVTAIRQVPQVNARFHEDNLEIFNDINIGVGTALGDDGLIVPVVEKVQDKDLFEIAQALHAQTDKARNGKITPADMKNGTFTISNHGVSGSLFAAPIIINQPQVAILGVGKLEKRVVVIEEDGKDTFIAQPMCYVSLSIDHRALDAFQTNKFLTAFVETIENWGQ